MNSEENRLDDAVIFEGMVPGHVLQHPEFPWRSLTIAAHHLNASQDRQLPVDHSRQSSASSSLLSSSSEKPISISSGGRVLRDILTTQNLPEPRLMSSSWNGDQLLGMSRSTLVRPAVGGRSKSQCREVGSADVEGAGGREAEPEVELRDVLCFTCEWQAPFAGAPPFPGLRVEGVGAHAWSLG